MVALTITNKRLPTLINLNIREGLTSTLLDVESVTTIMRQKIAYFSVLSDKVRRKEKLDMKFIYDDCSEKLALEEASAKLFRRFDHRFLISLIRCFVVVFKYALWRVVIRQSLHDLGPRYNLLDVELTMMIIGCEICLGKLLKNAGKCLGMEP
ncbi:hypothetical protein Tco_1110772 [Tanacetum coccineum]|uniref:Uncharacterized protein n=1 Tax=Tanacetum coccineum TaxID=301880 RepID=A0ABQ5IMA4_9ASTR